MNIPGPSDDTETLNSIDSPIERRSDVPPESKTRAQLEFAEPGTIVTARYRYRLIRRLGNGSFGSVFQAECLDRSDNAAPSGDVAIKVLGSSDEPEVVSALKRELAALRLINHSQIPRLYDWSLDGQIAFAVMEYFPAGSLADVRSFIGRLDVDQTWRLISDLLGALSAAHQASILHLDVKPSNVLLDQQGGYVLSDFGVSHASRMSKGLLHQGQIPIGLGTRGYRAPEQADQKIHSFDLRTDLWGVGATAWAMFTGIDLNRRKDVLRRKEDGCVFGLQALSDVHLACPPPLEEVIMGMLYLDPGLRPGGANEILSRIKSIASGFGIGSQSTISALRSNIQAKEVEDVINSLVDPLWSSICRTPGFSRYFAKFEDGETLCDVSQQMHHTHLLLRGTVRIERHGRVVDREKNEGTFLGAISTLATAPRQVTIRAEGTVWTCIFNEAELEQFVTCNPSVAVRMLRNMANRIASGPSRHSD